MGLTSIFLENWIGTMNFLSIDFETANADRYSACSVGLVRVENKKIVQKESLLIRPPDPYFHWANVMVHGLRWEDVKDQPTFKQHWKNIKPYFQDIDFVTAHNAPFDRSVLDSCCKIYNLKNPDVSFKCTVQIAKKLWGINPAKLPDVCDYFGIKLNHHEALSDAEACAKIMIKTIKDKEHLL
jgi:DNA polymerase-3 subunit epsilon